MVVERLRIAAANARGGGRRRRSAAQAMITSAARSIGYQVGRQIVRGILGSAQGAGTACQLLAEHERYRRRRPPTPPFRGVTAGRKLMTSTGVEMRAVLGAAGVAAVLAGCSDPSGAQAPDEAIRSEQATFRVVPVATGLEHPWGMAFLPNEEILVTERPGRLRIVRGGELVAEPIEGVPPVYARGQGGLLDVAPDPEFASNRVIYLAYAAVGDGGNSTRVARATLGDGRLEGLEVIFTAEPLVNSSYHFGSRLVFDPQGHLFITVGERGQGDRAQDLGDLNGSMIRLFPDGSVPEDNPFVGVAGARPEIFSYGHRNAQGLAIHPETGMLWLHEHGARGGDEVNVVRPGVNYGWPVITYGIDYSGAPIGEGTHKEGMAQAIHYWVPSIAPSGMAFYDGEAFPEWRGDLFVGALRSELLARLELEGEQVVAEERLLEGALGRVRDVEVGPDGYLYLLTDESDGGLYRLEPAEGAPAEG
jgi:glucose/arabinose dehydrogenase